MSQVNTNIDNVGTPKVLYLDQVFIGEKDALRGVKTDTDSFKGMIDTIQSQGMQHPISVRPVGDRYEIIDGAHRYTAAKMVGWTKIAVVSFDKDDDAKLESQIIGNFVNEPTKKVEVAKALKKLIERRPTVTVSSLAISLGKSAQWVQQQLDLTNLAKPIQEKVDAGEIGMTLAYAISNLPEEEQPNYIDACLTMKMEDAVNAITSRVKEIKKAKDEGRAAGPAQFVPKAYFRSMAEVKAEIEKPNVTANMTSADRAVFVSALTWVLSLDDATLATKKTAHEAHKVEMAKKKADAAAERAAKKAQAASAPPTVAQVLGVKD